MARLVFDLDGTLVDSAPDLQAVANRVLTGEGLAPITLGEARDFIGQGTAVFVRKMRARHGIPESEQPRLLASFMALYENAVEHTRPYPGAVEILSRLRESGHRLGLCTNKPLGPCMALLRHLEIDTCFDAITAGDSLPVHKPDPAPLLRTLESMGEGPAFFIGDSEIDGETASRAGIPFVFFTEGYSKVRMSALPYVATFSRYPHLPGLIDAMLRRVA
ncbi:HAD-IA family hydrolase [Aliiruegeria sabulilitoris]|uniref:HAD-IA family hydrolase n=1 Tax=Aliiruegeria sabulilitoris TaxID=1510458 RepID=UPI00082B1750|nr:HAD-IA family hydrolase [Aliiruegeria sabulilitoris]NDR59212.1 HAD-IA family hydrolase [Pseudoruegeria sp. M32A2M]